MDTPVVQRWSGGRASYRPAGEVIDTRVYEVALIPDDTTARAFIEANHYSGSYPSARERVGLYRNYNLVGLAVFSHPMNDGVLRRLPCPKDEATELGRFVLLDEEKANAETWFLARAFEFLRRAGYAGVVSFSDPVARADVGGEVTFPGHVGNIYQASNARFVGRGSPNTLRILPDGTVLSNRAISKIRTASREKPDQGWQYSARILERFGAPALRRDGDVEAWLRAALATYTRQLRHLGNLCYLFGLDRATRKRLPTGLPYPKIVLEKCGRGRPALTSIRRPQMSINFAA
jgi:hypothetical protein